MIRWPRKVKQTFFAAIDAIAVVALILPLSACGSANGNTRAGHMDGRINVVTTTGVLRDMVANVAGDAANVSSIVPDNADPHSYEPRLRSIRDVVYADLAFSNYMMLEEHGVITALDANLRKGVPNVELAEESVKHAADIIPMVEDVSLDTIWLGLATERMAAGAEAATVKSATVKSSEESQNSKSSHSSQVSQSSQSNAPSTVTKEGRATVIKPNAYNMKRSDRIRLTATKVKGPGALFAYLTGTFGSVETYVNSANGINDEDHVDLPADAHTHLSWAFSKPGEYTLDWHADILDAQGARVASLGNTSMRFAVGVNAQKVAKKRKARVVLNQGHADLAYDLASHGFMYRVDTLQEKRSAAPKRVYYAPHDVVVEVPTNALKEIPAEQGYRFLGAAREKLYQLPQAVLGKHVHGDIDPHLWQSVKNGIAYVRTIADRLCEVDPKNARKYRANADRYINKLLDVDAYMRKKVASIPKERRNLVTTHDAFAYLGKAYGVNIAGFVTINPSSEPSVQDRRRLSQILRDLEIPAVFLEPNLISRSSVLKELASEAHVKVCPIYGDAFDAKVRTYADMMRANADSLAKCLK
ncbi:ABC transporter substrate-binding protein [Gardnerella vaginalis]|uniref:ABC transporter substrate-binding protein n=1 Tax=Gardnerella vaginalis TaxID=2702 RepID=A0A3E1IR76_GARVA|nr:anchored repeat ABC transporter, substrate-binding protein [Gardnerella vaginalis]RFD75457.1 ABC transporter substrate-binding protein [Gardnerella vaginalis]